MSWSGHRLHKLQQKHEQLQALAQRATRASEVEEVGWDDDEAAPTPRANTKSGLDADNSSRPAQSTESGLPEGSEHALLHFTPVCLALRVDSFAAEPCSHATCCAVPRTLHIAK